MSNKITLKSFPFDSMKVLNEESGQMEDDRVYEAQRFREYYAKILTNGVCFSKYKNYKENSMKVILDGGMNIAVMNGSGFIEGTDFENESTKIFTIERPASGTRIDRVVVRLDKTLAVRETQLYIKEGNGTTPATLQRDDNAFEICLAEITAKSSANLEETDIVDKRLNEDLCGLVNSLITVDGEELYAQFQGYIDSVTDNLVRKDQANVTITGIFKDSIGGTSENNFSNDYKTKLDNIAVGATKVEIEDNLTSTSSEKALSAKQGKILNATKQDKLPKGTLVPISTTNGDVYMQYF